MSQLFTLSDGKQEWREGVLLHREDGPAVIHPDGTTVEYWINGKLHNPDGPAIVYANGEKEYWVDGFRIINGKPIIPTDNSWHNQGALHREEAPAISPYEIQASES